jgi:hypothetical protein
MKYVVLLHDGTEIFTPSPLMAERLRGKEGGQIYTLQEYAIATKKSASVEQCRYCNRLSSTVMCPICSGLVRTYKRYLLKGKPYVAVVRRLRTLERQVESLSIIAQVIQRKGELYLPPAQLLAEVKKINEESGF